MTRSIRSAPTCSLGLLVIGTFACAGEPEATADAGFEVVDSAGTEIVISRAPLWGPDEGWEIAQEPSLAIGAIESGDPAEQFSRPTALFSLSDGRIVVVESQAGEVRIFSPGGEHLRTAGGLGDGPAEFNHAQTALRLPGDTILVQNAPRLRHVLFDPEGEFVRSETLDLNAFRQLDRFVECVHEPLPDRSLLACVQHPTIEPLPSSPGPGLIRRMAQYVRVPWDLSSVDTLGKYGGLEQFGIPHGEWTRYAIHRFHSRTQLAIGDDPTRIAIAINPAYDIEIWMPDGELERVIRRPDGARAPTAGELGDAKADFTAFQVPGEADLTPRFRDEMPDPELVPAVASMTFARTGELLVGRTAAPGQAPEGRRMVDVFDAGGRWLGTIDAPSIGIHEVGEDYVLGIRFDDLQVPYIERYELRRNR